MPKLAPRPTATNPMSSELRLTKMMRESRWRPRWSVQSRNCPLGGRSSRPGCCAIGSYGLTMGAARAAKTRIPTTAAPKKPIGLRSVRSSACTSGGAGVALRGLRLAGVCGQTNAWIQEAIGQVRDQVHHNEDADQQEHARLDDHIVTIAHGGQDQGAPSGPRKDRFNDERPTEQPPDVETDGGRDWHQCVPQHVPTDNGDVGQTFCGRPPPVVV